MFTCIDSGRERDFIIYRILINSLTSISFMIFMFILSFQVSFFLSFRWSSREFNIIFTFLLFQASGKQAPSSSIFPLVFLATMITLLHTELSIDLSISFACSWSCSLPASYIVNFTAATSNPTVHTINSLPLFN